MASQLHLSTHGRLDTTQIIALVDSSPGDGTVEEKDWPAAGQKFLTVKEQRDALLLRLGGRSAFGLSGSLVSARRLTVLLLLLPSTVLEMQRAVTVHGCVLAVQLCVPVVQKFTVRTRHPFMVNLVFEPFYSYTFQLTD